MPPISSNWIDGKDACVRDIVSARNNIGRYIDTLKLHEKNRKIVQDAWQGSPEAKEIAKNMTKPINFDDDELHEDFKWVIVDQFGNIQEQL